MRRMLRKVSVCAISGTMLVVLFGCGGQNRAEALNQEEVAEIVEEFQQGSYEYRKTSTSGPDQEEVLAYEGKIIRDPYEEYVRIADEYAEMSSLVSEMYYTRDESGYSAQIKSPNGSITEQHIQPPTRYGYYGYGEELSFTYDREERVNDVRCNVYKAEYQDTVGGEPDFPGTEPIDFTIRQEYYIDPDKKQVVRVDTDLGERDRANEIIMSMVSAQSIGDPISQEEAEENVENRDFSAGEILEISNFNGSIDIQPLV